MVVCEMVSHHFFGMIRTILIKIAMLTIISHIFLEH